MTDEIPDAFLTGSRVYGEPREDSDIDMVVSLTPEVLIDLRELADAKEPGMDEPASGGPDTDSLRFGRLNLICVTVEEDKELWWNGTQDLLEARRTTGRPITREAAVAHFDSLRRQMYQDLPQEE